jgi:hypothetical protein
MKSSSCSIKADVRRLKSELEEGNDPEDISKLLAKTSQLKEMEENQALHWRRLSRIKRLGEREEVSKYYFNILKAKQKRETLNLLILDDGSEITHPSEILSAITKFHGSLYSAGCTTPATEQARRQLFALPCTKVDPGSKAMLKDPPTLQELKETLTLIPLDKSPGMDGLAAEVFWACWSFMANDFLAMALAF